MSDAPRILGINTSFSSLHYSGFIHDSFRSSTCFMDYDAIVIDTSYLINEYDVDSSSTYQGKRLISKDESYRMIEEFERTKTQVIEFLKRGKAKYTNTFGL